MVHKEGFYLEIQMIDIIFVVFMLLMAIFGYIKGFVTRLYDFIGTIFVLFVAYFLAKPISSIFMIYQYDSQDVLASMVGKMVNQIIVFVILLIVLTIIKKLLGIVIKPALKGFMDTFSLTSFVDKILGVGLSLIEGLLISYLALVFVVIPFYPKGRASIDNTVFASRVINLVPSVSQEVINLADTFDQTKDTSLHSIESLTKLMLTAKDMGLIDDEQIITLFQENIEKELGDQKISLSLSQKQQIEDIFKQSGYNQKQLQALLSKINVSDE